MPIVPFGEFLPDLPQFGNPGTVNVLNVVPLTTGSYGPARTPVVAAPALPDPPVRGSWSYESPTFLIYNFAATHQHLYLQKTGSTTFNVVDGPSAPYTTSTDDDGFWDFTSFGSRIIATNYSDPIQTYNTATDTAFSDLSSTAPRARYCCVTRDFLMVANTYDGIDGPQPHRVWWPAIGDPLNWPTPGSDVAIEVQSDYNDLEQSELGDITGIVGGHLSQADGAVFCERGVYRVQYAGSPAIWDFVVAQGASGTGSPLSLVQRRIGTPGSTYSSVIYYYSAEGFLAFDGSSSVGIGAQKVDRYMLDDLDPNRVEAVQGVYDPLHKLILWLYHGKQNNGFYNKGLVFNYELMRWAPVDLTASPIGWGAGEMASVSGYTLDELDPFGTIDQLQFSLDSRRWTGGVPMWGLFDTNGAQCFNTGPSMRATLETGETQLFPGRRARIKGTRPIADSVQPVSICVGTRDKTRDPVVYTTLIPENILGNCPQRTTGRYTRFQMVVPAGANPIHLQGIDVDAMPEGTR